jgi:hypothetical protein
VATDTKLKELERRAWTSFFQDGLWDIYLGLMLLALGLYAQFEFDYLVLAAMFVPAILVLILGKRLITAPRLGRVQFGRKRRVSLMQAAAVLLAALALGVVLYLVSFVYSPEAGTAGVDWMPIVLAAVPLVVFFFTALLLDFKRLYYIGAVFAVGFYSTTMLHNGIPFFISAAAVLLPGTIIFAGFLRKHPLSKAEEEAGA